MIILNGSYLYFSLSSLLRFLYSSKITGILSLIRKNEIIKIHLLTGRPIGVESTRKKQDPLEDLIDSAVWLEGEFSFETVSEEKIIKNITIASDQLILLLAKKEKTFQELKKSLPPLDAILVMNPAGQNGEIRLQPDEWNFLSKVDGKKTLGDLVRSVDMSELSIFAITVKLTQKGILKVVGPAHRGKAEEAELEALTKEEKEGEISKKLESLEKIFMRYVGPMGTIIMDEITESLNIHKEHVSSEEILELVEKLSLEIESEEEKSQFEEEVSKSFNDNEANS